ncbi:MAG: hypothetical protein HKM94_04785 [Halobacteria archaeon]|nr:hypothetical protein [Halobacteria archaeon]
MSVKTQTYLRVMTITHTEFLRSLLPLKKHYSYKINPDKTSIFITDGPRHINIKLGPENIMQLGALQMPSTEVKFTFSAFSPSELDEFWRLFDLSFRRGGG